MKSFKKNRLIQILYPLFLYYIVYHFSNLLYFMIFKDHFGRLFCLMLAALTTIPFLVFEYKRLPIVRMDGFRKEDIGKSLISIVLIVFTGIGLNVFVSNLPLESISQGFSQANETLSDGMLLIQILSNAVFIPLLEEFLYRGIICGQLSLWYKPWIGILISSLLFGIMHFNVIQFLYAFLVGLVLGSTYIKTKNIWIPVLGHGLTNLIVILYFM